MLKLSFGILISSALIWWSSQAFVMPSGSFLSSSLSFQCDLHPPRKSKETKASISSLSLSVASSSSIVDEECDVLVLGSGPAARAIAYLLSAPQNKLDILLADSNYDKKWPPNYGVWEDEWQAICNAYQQEFNRMDIANDKCIDRRWSVTDCYFGGSFDIPTTQRFRIDRPYLRIDKDYLQQALSPKKDNNSDQGWYRVLKANHISQAINVNVYSPPLSLVHDDTGSTIQLLPSNDKDEAAATTDKLINVRAKLIVDCTGHETKLVLKDTRVKSIPPGFQIAYGCLVKVNTTLPSYTDTQIGPYDKEAMTLFDYRTDHFQNDVELQKAQMAPTFMYAMPLKDNRIFFEETSLVARPAISFQECKDRTETRLKHLGIEVIDIEEEEFCYIPMGGPLPEKNQRVIAFGGASAMVHPSTGYNLCRNLMGAVDVTKAIVNGLSSTNKNPNLDSIAGNAYHAMWSPSNVRQRNFAVFGGEFLMKQNVEGLRGFFDGFFRLSIEMWGGFLAGWPGLPNNDKHDNWFARLWFGLTFVSKLPPKVAFDMLASIVTYSITEGVALPQSVTPLFGEPESYEYTERPKNQGDVAAKNEARRMIQESMVEVEVPVSFESEKEKV